MTTDPISQTPSGGATPGPQATECGAQMGPAQHACQAAYRAERANQGGEPVPAPAGDVDRTIVLSLQIHGLHQSMKQAYRTAIAALAEKVIAGCASDGARSKHLHKDKKEQLKRLLDSSFSDVLTLVWKETGPVSDAALIRAGLSRSFAGSPLTRNAIGNALRVQENVPKTEKTVRRFAQRAKRYVDAAIAFGLIESDASTIADIRDNCKPLKATAKLCDLMVEIAILNAAMINAAMVRRVDGTTAMPEDVSSDPSA